MVERLMDRYERLRRARTDRAFAQHLKARMEKQWQSGKLGDAFAPAIWLEDVNCYGGFLLQGQAHEETAQA